MSLSSGKAATDNPLVEAVAGAIAYAEGNASDSGIWPKWSDYRDHATAALRAIEDAGYKIIVDTAAPSTKTDL